MWKYNKTDELYHSLKSRYYMAVDNSEYLQHFKYVKREKKNGRWVYYYDTDLDKQRDILKSNIRMQENMIKNNKTYTNPQTGQKFGPDHYKKAVKYDKQELRKIEAKIKISKAIINKLNAFESKRKLIGKKWFSKFLK